MASRRMIRVLSTSPLQVWQDSLASGETTYNYAEHNAINRFNPKTGMIEPFVRDPAIQVS